MQDIEIRGLSKRFGDRVLFQNLDLTLPAGRITVLMGPSGIGKTTLLRILMGLETCDGGGISGVPGAMSAVFQEDRLIPGLSAVQNAALGCRRLPSREAVLGHLRAMGLTENLDSPVGELSGGMARRVAVARACLAPSDVIFMDEPLRGLDVENALRAIAHIRSVQGGRTVVAVAHDRNLAGKLGDGIVRLEELRRAIE